MWAAPNVLANWASRCGSRSCSRRFTERAYPISVESIYSEGNFATVAGKASANGAVHLAATDLAAETLAERIATVLPRRLARAD